MIAWLNLVIKEVEDGIVKYIVLEIIQDELTREVPIIFPAFMIHADVAKYIKHQLAMEHETTNVKTVSAGELNLFGAELNCSGFSETLNIKSRGVEDTQLLSMYNYTHGVI